MWLLAWKSEGGWDNPSVPWIVWLSSAALWHRWLRTGIWCFTTRQSSLVESFWISPNLEDVTNRSPRALLSVPAVSSTEQSLQRGAEVTLPAFAGAAPAAATAPPSLSTAKWTGLLNSSVERGKPRTVSTERPELQPPLLQCASKASPERHRLREAMTEWHSRGRTELAGKLTQFQLSWSPFHKDELSSSSVTFFLATSAGYRSGLLPCQHRCKDISWHFQQGRPRELCRVHHCGDAEDISASTALCPSSKTGPRHFRFSFNTLITLSTNLQDLTNKQLNFSSENIRNYVSWRWRREKSCLGSQVLWALGNPYRYFWASIFVSLLQSHFLLGNMTSKDPKLTHST